MLPDRSNSWERLDPKVEKQYRKKSPSAKKVSIRKSLNKNFLLKVRKSRNVKIIESGKSKTKEIIKAALESESSESETAVAFD